MSSAAVQHDLWSLVTGNPSIDPQALLVAIDQAATTPDHDFRTKLLIRDALAALRQYWGSDVLDARLSTAARSLRDCIDAADLGAAGFPSLERRMAEATRAE